MNIFKTLCSLTFILVIAWPLYSMEQAKDIFDEKINLGNTFLEKKDYISALSFFKSALQQDSNLLAKRTAQQKLNTLFGENLQLLEPYLVKEAQQGTNLTTKAKAAVALGELYQRHTEFQKAIPYLMYAEQQSFNQASKAEARILLAQILLDKDEYQNAIPYLKAILEQPKANEYIKAAVTGTLGLMYQLLNDYQQAIPFFQKAAEQNINHIARVASLAQLGQIYFRNKEYEQALPILRQVAEQSEWPFFQADANYWLGASYFRLNDFTKALETLKLVANQTSNPKARASALLLLGQISMELKNYDNAIFYLQEAANQQDHPTVQTYAQDEINRMYGAENLALFEQTARDAKRERGPEKETVLEKALQTAPKKMREEGQ